MKNEIRKELLDELLAGYKSPEDLTGPEGLLKRLTGALVGRALDAEMTEHAESADFDEPRTPITRCRSRRTSWSASSRSTLPTRLGSPT
jgi:putative transposase